MIFDALRLVALLALSLSVNVALLSRGTLAGADKKGPPSALGTTIGDLSGLAASGAPIRLSLTDGTKDTVVFVYSPKCPWCQRTWPVFQRIAAERSAAFRFLAVCLGDFSEAFPADFQVVTRPSRETLSALHIASVPTTLVISQAGKVERVWTGAFKGAVGEGVSRFFGIRFNE